MFKSPGHRTYEYKPRFWDEKKERKAELERLVEEARSGNLTEGRRNEKFRQEIGEKWGSKRHTRSKGGSDYATRFMVIFAVLIGLVWLFLHWD